MLLGKDNLQFNWCNTLTQISESENWCVVLFTKLSRSEIRFLCRRGFIESIERKKNTIAKKIVYWCSSIGFQRGYFYYVESSPNKKKHFILEAIANSFLNVPFLVHSSIMTFCHRSIGIFAFENISSKLHLHTIKLFFSLDTFRSIVLFAQAVMLVFASDHTNTHKKKQQHRKTISWKKKFMCSTHCDQNCFYWTPKAIRIYCVREMELECDVKKLVRELLFTLCSTMLLGMVSLCSILKIINTNGTE